MTQRPGWRALPPLFVLLAVCSSGACASSGAVPSPFPQPGGPQVVGSGPPLDPAALVSTALALQGVPYRSGGLDPSGFDCSGLVAYVFAQHGAVVPRTVSAQYGLGRTVSRRALQAGDLVFFSTRGPGASHVGIAVSPEQFVHAPTSSGVVRVEPLGSRYWARRFVGARRIH